MNLERTEPAVPSAEEDGQKTPQIEVVPVVGGAGRKVSPDVIKEQQEFLKKEEEKKERAAERERLREERLKRAEEIGAKIKAGKLISALEKSEVEWAQDIKAQRAARRAAEGAEEEEAEPPFKVVDRRRFPPAGGADRNRETNAAPEADNLTETERQRQLEDWLVGVVGSRPPEDALNRAAVGGTQEDADKEERGTTARDGAEAGSAERSEGLREIMDDLEKAPQAVREEMGAGFWALGHGVEEKKNVLWAKGFEKAATQFDRRSIAGRFIASLAQSFREDAAEARKKIEEIRALRAEDQGARLLRHKVGGIGYLVGNITKYARFIGDLPGVDAFVFAPRRYWMMGGMLVGRLAGAVKETRLTGEKAMERARGAKAPEGRNLASGLEIADEQEWDKLDLDPDYKKAVDDAWDEALHVYADARKKSGERKVSCGDLEKAYQQNIPQQVLERLQKQSTEAGIVAGLPRRVTQWVAERSIASVAKKIEAIEENPNLTAAEKEAAKEEVAVRYRKRLRDLDRMVDYYGAVDGIAAAAKSTEFAGKAAVAAMSVDTLYAGVRHLWERGLPEFFVNATRHAKDLFSGTVLTPTTLGASDFRASSAFQNSAAAGKPGVAEHDALYGRSLGAQRGSAGTSPAETPGTSSREAASGAGGGGGPRPEAARAAQAAGETPDAVPRGGAKPEAGAAKAAAWERTAGKKDSPLSLAKKIYMEQAQRFGYKGDLKDVAALRQWAETQSTRSIVGQYIRGNQGQYQELIGKIGKPPADPQEMDVWLKKVPVKTFNNILHDKVPNLIHPGDIVRVTENGEITALSLDGKTARLGRIDVAESARARGGRGPVQPRESIFQPEKGYAYDPTTGRNNPQLDLEPFSAPSRLEQTVGLPGSEELAHVSRALNVDLSSVDGDVAFEAVRDYQIFTKGTLLDKENIVERLERDIGHLKQIAGTDAQHEAAVKTIIANHFTDLIERSYTQYFRLLGQYGLDEVKVEQLEGLGRGDVGRVLNMLGAAQEIEGVGVNIGGNTGVFRNKYDADQFGEYLRRLLGRTPSLAREPLEEALKRQVR